MSGEEMGRTLGVSRADGSGESRDSDHCQAQASGSSNGSLVVGRPENRRGHELVRLDAVDKILLLMVVLLGRADLADGRDGVRGGPGLDELGEDEATVAEGRTVGKDGT